MRTLIVSAFACLLLATQSAQAWPYEEPAGYPRIYRKTAVRPPLARRGPAAALSGACRSVWPKSCGCYAQEVVFGTSARMLNGLNLYWAATWAVFPHVPAAPGTVALFSRGRRIYHVAVVRSVGDSTVTVEQPGGRLVAFSKSMIVAYVAPR